MTEAFKGAARLEKQQDKIDNKIKELDKKIAEIKQEADKQQQKIDDAKEKIKDFLNQQKGLHPQDTLAIALEKQIKQQREKAADAKKLLNIYQTQLQNLQNEKEEVLKKKEKLTETYNEKVDEDSAKKLKEFL